MKTEVEGNENGNRKSNDEIYTALKVQQEKNRPLIKVTKCKETELSNGQNFKNIEEIFVEKTVRVR